MRLFAKLFFEVSTFSNLNNILKVLKLLKIHCETLRIVRNLMFLKILKDLSISIWTFAIIQPFFLGFPSGILQHPFFNAENPRYTNYAGIGAIVGHEMTHGFDDTGRQFSQDGNFLDWWDSKTKEKFLEKAKCIVQQYSNYTSKELNLKVSHESLLKILFAGERLKF